MENNKTNMPGKKSNSLLWTILFFVIALMCIYTVVTLNKSFSMTNFIDFIRNADLIWLTLAFAFVIFSVVIEGFAIKAIVGSLGYHKKGSGFFYAAADFYFSAITPSATGGQPASGYFMVKDGIPGPVTTAALLYNLMIYTLSIVILAFVTLLFNFNVFLSFSTISKVFVLCGFVIQVGLVIVSALLLYKGKFLYNICKSFLNLLTKMHIIKNPKKKLAKLTDTMEKYQTCAKLLQGKTAVLIKVLFCNLLQRFFILIIPFCIYMATYGDINNAYSIWNTQVMVAVGATFIPIPGAMGITDYLMLDGFKKIMSISAATNLELLSRVISFYSCAIICGISTLTKYCLLRRGSKNDRIL